jgi:hypothetical protein
MKGPKDCGIFLLLDSEGYESGLDSSARAEFGIIEVLIGVLLVAFLLFVVVSIERLQKAPGLNYSREFGPARQQRREREWIQQMSDDEILLLCRTDSTVHLPGSPFADVPDRRQIAVDVARGRGLDPLVKKAPTATKRGCRPGSLRRSRRL